MDFRSDIPVHRAPSSAAGLSHRIEARAGQTKLSQATDEFLE
jgi:hypothetical protein